MIRPNGSDRDEMHEMSAEQRIQRRRARRWQNGALGGLESKLRHGAVVFRNAAIWRWMAAREATRVCEVRLRKQMESQGLSVRTRREARVTFTRLFPEFYSEVSSHRVSLGRIAKVFGIHRDTARKWFREELAQRPKPGFNRQAWERRIQRQLKPDDGVSNMRQAR